MKGQRPSWRSRLAVLISATIAASVLGSGCFNGAIGEPGTSCQSTRAYFLTEVWGTVLAQRCLSCHTTGGQAPLAGARFQLLPASYPDFADANLASSVGMINILHNVNGRQLPAILAKPLGLVSHGGGSVITEGSPEYSALAGLVARVNAGAQSNDSACRDYGSLAAPSGVALLDWRQTLRKASLDMLGRLPTEAEYAAGTTDDRAFETTLRGMIVNDPAYYDRWRVAWNDLMLTDRYISGDACNQPALNMISANDFPGRGTYGGGGEGSCCDGNEMNRDRYNSTECVEQRRLMLSANNAVAQEPINLFEYVVRGNRPFSEILTADYTLVNSASARIYGVESQYPMGYGSEQLAPARITYNRRYSMTDTESVEFPHAGLLTMPAFLSRYPTTETNRNRHRARIVQSYFLNTDILKVGERPLDAAAVEAQVQTPTMNYGPCRTCHTINDPIAGAFRGFFPSDNTQWRYNPRDQWYNDMFPPGFNGEDMPGTEYRSALRWLAPRVVEDPRFVSSVVRFVYHSLTSREPLVYPTDTADPLYNQRAAAWVEQDRIFRAIGRRFVAENRNFHTVVLEMIKSPLYRANVVVFPPNLPQEQIAARMTEHLGIGTANLLTPEQLDRRIRAIAGFGWLRDMRANDPMRPSSIQREQTAREENGGHLPRRANQGLLVNEYYFPYGGINSDTIVRRVSDPSGIIIGVAERMANEIACVGTAFDFTRGQAERRFFPNVQRDTVPEAGGAPVPGNVANIRQNIAYLHNLILGENLTPDDPEVTRTFELFRDTFRENRMPRMDGMPNTGLACDATFNPVTGEALPMDQRITEDPDGTVRAWQAVLSYLFQDYRFLYQ